ncbi:M23 family metallopeptidase [Staphylococcus canis]|uniref:lysostaphin n=1 Tax=Staphylococcus canis TaxID=2724942 RepID=A0ABS0T7C7_9STAP|nr:M23 family metallopeptidase [Staphylococcus canis]MBI5974480.1 M23 family metallopeptidase [Staphylococcus canis]
MRKWLSPLILLLVLGSVIFALFYYKEHVQEHYDKYTKQLDTFFEQDRETHGFGKYNHQLSFNGNNRHYGIDYRLPVGSKVLAPTDGIVTRLFKDELGGNVLEIQESNGQYYEWFMHLDSYNVKVGDAVQVGDVIATSGNTGKQTTGPHLHFQRMNGGIGNRYAEDPKPFVESLPNGQRSLYQLK